MTQALCVFSKPGIFCPPSSNFFLYNGECLDYLGIVSEDSLVLTEHSKCSADNELIWRSYLEF